MVRCYALTFLFLLLPALMLAGPTTRPPVRTDRPLPAGFVPNIGQVHWGDGEPAPHVQATFTWNGTTAFIHPEGMHVVQQRVHRLPARPYEETEADVLRSDIVFVGANPMARVDYASPHPHSVRYLKGSIDPAAQTTRSYTTMTYHDVWPGIDVRMYVTTAGLKYDFIVHPGADPGRIVMRYDGVDRLKVTSTGRLEASTGLGTLSEDAPVCYTIPSATSAVRTSVRARYDVDGAAVRFALGDYSGNDVLVIDPQRVWATYYGGAGDFYNAKVAFDGDGNVILAGTTPVANLPRSTGVIQNRIKGGNDGFATKFDDRGNLVWHTYYGGDKEDIFFDVKTDAKNCIWLCGTTSSGNLPYRNGGVLQGSGAYGDPDSVDPSPEALIVKLNPDGSWNDSWLIYGRGADVATGIAIRKDRIAICGYTRSPKLGGLYGTPYLFNPLNNYNQTEMFICQVKPRVNSTDRWTNDWLTFYGSGNDDFAQGVAYDPQGNVLVAGNVEDLGVSAPFPTTDGTALRGDIDGVILKFSPTGQRLFVTVIGGDKVDQVNGIAADGIGNVIVAGQTASQNLPVANAIQPAYGGSFLDGFVAKYNGLGNVQFLSYIGGNKMDGMKSVAVDRSNNIWLSGFTGFESNLPTTPDAFRTQPSTESGSDSYIVKLNPAGTTRLYASYFCGDPQHPVPPAVPATMNTDFGDDFGDAIACDADAYIVMGTLTRTFRMPVTPGAYQDSAHIQQDTLRYNAFVGYLSDCRDSVIDIVSNGPAVLCANEARQLLAPTGFAQYRWSTGDTTRTITVSDTGSYIVMCRTQQGCRYRDTIVITRNPRPVVRAGNDVSGCRDSMIVLTADASGGTAPYRYKWNRIESGPDYIDSDTIPSPKVYPPTASRYEVLVTDAAGCTARDTVAVSIVDPRPTFSPASVDFGAVEACASYRDTTVTITNPMLYEIALTNFIADKADVSLLTSLSPAITIPASGSTTIRVRFSPAATGTTTGTFRLVGTPCSWSLAVPYRGTRQSLTATVQPGSIGFGSSTSCETVVRDTVVIIRNGSTGTMTVEPGLVAAPFNVIEPTTPTTLAAGETLAVRIRYTPTANGTFNDVVRLAFQAGACRDTLRVNLNATRANVAVRIEPSSFVMPELKGCETTRDTTLTLFNDSDVPVTVELSPQPNGWWAVSPSGPITIPARNSAQVRIEARPALEGQTSETFTFKVRPCDQTIAVKGTITKQGMVLSAPYILDFGEVAWCPPFNDASVRRDSMFYINGIEGTASIASLRLPADFTTTLTEGMQFPPDTRVAFAVTWRPTRTGAYLDSIVIVLQPCDIRHVIVVKGSATTPSLRAETPVVNAGTIAQTTSGTVRFTNDGTAPIGVVLTSPATTTITATRPALPATLAPGAVIDIDYRTVCDGRTDVSDTIRADFASATAPECASATKTVITARCSDDVPVSIGGTNVVDTVAVTTGQRFRLPIRLVSSTGLSALANKAWSADIAYDPAILVGSGTTPDCFTAGQAGPCTITLTGTTTDTTGTLTELDFTAVLGNTSHSDVKLVGFTWSDAPDATMTLVDGHVTITDICPVDGGRYLVPKANGLRIGIHPVPAADEMTIDLEGLGKEGAMWTMHSSIGREVAAGTFQPDASGTGHTLVDVKSIAAGTYVLTITAHGTMFSMPVLITR